jgi:ferric-dicitrate binding protein FerR (iron transport regulator)
MAASHSDNDVAETLRREPPRLDDVTRARMERRVIEAARERRRDSLAPPQPEPPRRSRSVVVAAAVAATAAAGITLGLVHWSGWAGPGARSGAVAESRTHGTAESAAPESQDTRSRAASFESKPESHGQDIQQNTEALREARFQVVSAGRTVRKGTLGEGSELRTGQSERLDVELQQTRIEVAPESVAAVERMDAKEIRLKLDQGEADFEFHPHEPEQRMVVETHGARVEVVGTAFDVRAGRGEGTTVRVREGVVRVQARRSGRSWRVSAGERVNVGGPEEDATEPERSRAAAGGGTSSPSTDERADAQAPSEQTAAAEAKEPPADDGLPESPYGRARGAKASGQPARSWGPGALDRARFELAERLASRGRFEEARHELYRIARRARSAQAWVLAWQRVADTFERQDEYAQAAEAYRRAADVGGASSQGLNAIFALARLRERKLDDPGGARAAYRDYLEIAPNGPLAAEASRRLCQLGDDSACR